MPKHPDFIPDYPSAPIEDFKQPESTQYELPDLVPDWKDAPEDATHLAMEWNGRWFFWKGKPSIFGGGWNGDDCKIAYFSIGNNCACQTTNATRLHPDYWKNSLQERPAPDYTHLLPDGYEFCAEENAEKWVKVEMNPGTPEHEQNAVGYVWLSPINPSSKCFRPIRPIQYHVAIHESVTAEPDPYQVDWSNAPEWADVHCFDANGKGNWYGVKRDEIEWYRYNIGNSGFTLPSGLDWKQSKRLNPKLK
jgi:hypothetical protein